MPSALRLLRASIAFVLITHGLAHAEDAPLSWRTDLEVARKEAADAGKPLLVLFRCVP